MDASADRVMLRPLAPEDAGVIAGWAADPGFRRAAGWSDRTRSEHERFQARLIASPPADLIRLAAIYQGVLVGYVDLHGAEPHRRELGFLIGERSRWGLGLGRLAAAAGLDHGFDGLGLHTIWAEAFDANTRSIRILQHLGLVETGRGDEGAYLDQPTFNRRFEIGSAAWSGS